MVKRQYGKSSADYERYSVVAMTSLYGVEILEDNVEACRRNLYEIWNGEYRECVKKQAPVDCCETVKFILRKNIICGDALTLLKNDGTPIVFAEWSLVTGNLIKRRDFELSQLLEGHQEQMSLDMVGWEYNEEVQAFIPAPVREYPPTDYRRLAQYE